MLSIFLPFFTFYAVRPSTMWRTSKLVLPFFDEVGYISIIASVFFVFCVESSLLFTPTIWTAITPFYLP